VTEATRVAKTFRDVLKANSVFLFRQPCSPPTPPPATRAASSGASSGSDLNGMPPKLEHSVSRSFTMDTRLLQQPESHLKLFDDRVNTEVDW
jgi:hypothetical protein